MNYDLVANLIFDPVVVSVAPRDAILYALGVGAASIYTESNPELKFVYETGLQILPTMATILAETNGWIQDSKFGIDWERVLHGEQRLTLHRPIPLQTEIVGYSRIMSVYDKGKEKGAVVDLLRELRLNQTGELIASVGQSIFLRGDGGQGGLKSGAPKRLALPERSADAAIILATRPDQGLIYRLSGDYNPLHVDPAVARSAGFVRPILHGLCTYGLVGRAVSLLLCEGDSNRLCRFDARFSSPVYPGESILTEIWRKGSGKASLRAMVIERKCVALNHGLVEFLE